PRSDGHCWPISWRASAPSAPRNGVDLRPPTATRDGRLQASTDYCCHGRMAIAGRFPGGRPLRRRREMVLIYGRQRLPGTVALQGSIDYCWRDRMAIAGRFPGGRPLRRRREMVLIYGRPRLRGSLAPQGLID